MTMGLTPPSILLKVIRAQGVGRAWHPWHPGHTLQVRCWGTGSPAEAWHLVPGPIGAPVQCGVSMAPGSGQSPGHAGLAPHTSPLYEAGQSGFCVDTG